MITRPSFLRINNGVATRNGVPLLHLPKADPEELYRALQGGYPKFFKMDVLSKCAWLGAEALLREGDALLYEGMDKNKIAVVLATKNGCLQTDKRYAETLTTIPSPALFVYTLPNIMLGEICIRHGFKGEQLCLVQPAFHAEELHFWAHDLLTNRGMDACLTGWADATDDYHDICLFWITRQQATDPGWMQSVYEQTITAHNPPAP